MVVCYRGLSVNRLSSELSQTLSVLIFVVPLVIVAVFTGGLYSAEYASVFKWLLLESKPVEWVQFFALLAAAVVSGKIALCLKARGVLECYLYVLVGLGLFFVAMEEISWGQWVFHFEPPEIFKEVNKQQELNVHNLPFFHTLFEILRAAIGMVGMVFIVFKNNSMLRYIQIPWACMSWFILIFVLGILDVPNVNVRPEDSMLRSWSADMVEVLELLISLVAFIVVWFNLKRINAVTE